MAEARHRPPQRLTSSSDISAVLRARRQRAGRLAVVHVRPRDGVVPSAGPSRDPASAGTGVRIAVIASRKVGGAVARNRAKRLLREAARHLAWRDDLDVVLIARASAASSVFTHVHHELDELARALGALTAASPQAMVAEPDTARIRT